VAVMTLGDPIGSSILAYFILKEAPGMTVIAGGGLILVGIYFVTRGNGKKLNTNDTTLKEQRAGGHEGKNAKRNGRK
jgi:drug/metabolite transporter (DMT)-like permease